MGHRTLKDAENAAKDAKAAYGDGVSTKIIIYNDTKHTLTFKQEKHFSGRFHKRPDATIGPDEWSTFLHVKKDGAACGSIGCVVYSVNGAKDAFLGWHTPYCGKNRVYSEVRDRGHWPTTAAWDYMENRLQNAKGTHRDEFGGFVASSRTGKESSPTAYFEMRDKPFTVADSAKAEDSANRVNQAEERQTTSTDHARAEEIFYRAAAQAQNMHTARLADRDTAHGRRVNHATADDDSANLNAEQAERVLRSIPAAMALAEKVAESISKLITTISDFREIASSCKTEEELNKHYNKARTILFGVTGSLAAACVGVLEFTKIFSLIATPLGFGAIVASIILAGAASFCVLLMEYWRRLDALREQQVSKQFPEQVEEETYTDDQAESSLDVEAEDVEAEDMALDQHIAKLRSARQMTAERRHASSTQASTHPADLKLGTCPPGQTGQYSLSLRACCHSRRHALNPKKKNANADFSSTALVKFAVKLARRADPLVVVAGCLQDLQADGSWISMDSKVEGNSFPEVELLICWLDLETHYSGQAALEDQGVPLDARDFTMALESIEICITPTHGEKTCSHGQQIIDVVLSSGHPRLWDAANALFVSCPGMRKQDFLELPMHSFFKAGVTRYWEIGWNKEACKHVYQDKFAFNCFDKEGKWVGHGAGSSRGIYRHYLSSRGLETLIADYGNVLENISKIPSCDFPYYCKPSVAELRARVAQDPKYLDAVPGFSIGCEKYGQVTFSEPVDVRELKSCNSAVRFSPGQVESCPEILEHREAEIVLFNLLPLDKCDENDFCRHLRDKEAGFVSYSLKSGGWTFTTDNFECHSFPESNLREPHLYNGPQSAELLIEKLLAQPDVVRLRVNKKILMSWCTGTDGSEPASRMQGGDQEEVLEKVFATLLETKKWTSVHYTQRLAVGLLLTAVHQKDRQARHLVLEMLTGEGKSAVLAMVAAAVCLIDKESVVDIVTSSPVLARRDCDSWQQLFKALGLSAAYNCDEGRPGDSKPYEHRIVYGTISSFAGDRLRTEFHKQTVCHTGGKTRPYGVLLVDEVDNLLLDNGLRTTYLSDSFPGLHHIQPVLAALWIGVSTVVPRALCTDTGEQFFVSRSASEVARPEGLCDPQALSGRSSSDAPLFRVWVLNESGGLELTGWMETDSSMDLLDCGDSETAKYQRLFSPSQLATELRDNAKGMLSYDKACPKEGNECRIQLPSYLRSYIEDVLPSFARSAIQALQLQEDRDYVVSGTEDSGYTISPVDSATGVTQLHTHLSDGLHQFLQLKHGLSVSEFGLTSNFLSNFHFIKRYQHGSILGLTGTKGTEKELGFLWRQFGLVAASMPPLRPRRIVEHPAQLVSLQTEWLDAIAASVCTPRAEVENTKPGPCLVLCRDICTARLVKQHLDQLAPADGAGHSFRVIQYIRSDSDEDPLKNRFFSGGDVIVATNLASRGTDILLAPDAEALGGLHVVLTYLPDSKRAEWQAYGRTGRQGASGSVQTVAMRRELPAAARLKNIDDVREERDRQHAEHIDLLESRDLAVVNMQEERFQEFCSEFLSGDIGGNRFVSAACEMWALWLHRQAIAADATPGRTIQALPVKNWKMLVGNWKKGIYQGMSSYQAAKIAGHVIASSKDSCAADQLLSWAMSAEPSWTLIPCYLAALRAIQKADKKSAVEFLKDALVQVDKYTASFQLTCIAAKAYARAQKPDDVDQKEMVGPQLAAQLNILKHLKENIGRNISKLEALDIERIRLDYQPVLYGLITAPAKEETDMLCWCESLGIVNVFSVEEKSPPFNFNALACFFIGVAQLVAGAAVMVCTLGTAANLGMGLISEGVSDLAEGVMGMISGSFNWAQWAVQKAINVGMAILCAGVSRVKGVVKTAVQAACEARAAKNTVMKSAKAGLQAGSKAARGAVSEVARSGRVVAQSLAESHKVGARAIAKQTARLVAKETALAAIVKTANYALAVGLSLLRDHVVKKLADRFRKCMDEDVEFWDSLSCFFSPQLLADAKLAELQRLFDRKVLAETALRARGNPEVAQNFQSIGQTVATITESSTLQTTLAGHQILMAVEGLLKALTLDSLLMRELRKTLRQPAARCAAGIHAAAEEVPDPDAVRSNFVKLKPALLESSVAAFTALCHEELSRKVESAISSAASSFVHEKVRATLDPSAELERIKQAGEVRYARDAIRNLGPQHNSQSTCPEAVAAARNIEKKDFEMGVLEIEAIAKSQGRCIVVQDKDGREQIFNRADQQNGLPSVQLLYDPEARHYSLLENGEPVKVVSSIYKKGCLPAAVAHGVGKKEQKIRQEAAAHVLKLDPKSAMLMTKYQDRQDDSYMNLFLQPGGAEGPARFSFDFRSKHVAADGQLLSEAALENRTRRGDMAGMERNDFNSELKLIGRDDANNSVMADGSTVTDREGNVYVRSMGPPGGRKQNEKRYKHKEIASREAPKTNTTFDARDIDFIQAKDQSGMNKYQMRLCTRGKHRYIDHKTDVNGKIIGTETGAARIFATADKASNLIVHLEKVEK